jgi:ABC-type methionine transport system ATPase subunit
LVYDSINAYRQQDFRETLIAFCVIYHSAREIGLNTDILFKEVAKISSSKMALLMLEFIERPEKSKALKSFYLKRVVEKDGTVRFKLNLR